jgi:hypothetical protein
VPPGCNRSCVEETAGIDRIIQLAGPASTSII